MFEKKKKEIASLDVFTYDCDGCGQCIDHCRQKVLRMVNNGYCSYAIVGSPEKCDGCGKCLRACKNGAIELSLLEN